ncbi:MAG: TonB-dependent siderophore receptor [Opitutaceae bacterium]
MPSRSVLLGALDPRRCFLLSLVVAAFALASATAADQATASRPFDLAADSAERSLRRFSEQSGLQVIFSAEVTSDARTRAVRGDYPPLRALDLMLDGAGLVAVRNERTGAITVQRAPAPSPPKKEPARVESRAAAASDGANGDTVTLSPFVVRSEKDNGYQAQNTLSGTRLNSSLANIPASIQVLTKELLLDLNVTDYEGYLNFATNAGRDFSDITGLASVQQGNNQVRIRGFTGAEITRDFFLSQTRSDRFSIERYEVSRGPNSILFGIGGPGGVVNSSSKIARIDSRQQDQVRTTAGSWDNFRAELDFNRTLLRQKLAVRTNFLFEDKEGWRDYEFQKRLGVAVAATWQPWRNTQVRVNYEYVDTKQNQAFPFPTADTAGAWIAAGKPIASGPIYELGTPTPAGTVSSFSDEIRYAPQVSPLAYRYGDTRIVDANATLAGAQRVRFFDTLNAPNSPVGGVVTYTNFAAVPQTANLTGAGNRSDNHYGLFSAFIEQRAGPVAIELAYNRQNDFWRSNFPLSWWVVGVRGDANPELPGYYLSTATLGGTPPGQLLATPFARNPFAGQFYVEAQSRFRIQRRETDNFRATLSLALDLRKRSKWLGSHQIAALAQRQDSEYYTDIFSEYNLARDNALAFTAAQNQIIRRTYVDFTTPGAPRGAHDPFANPIVSPGVQAGYLRNAQTNRQRAITDSYMAVVQSNFLEERLVVTLGVRSDELKNNRAGGGALQPAAGPLGGTWTEHTVYTDAGKTNFSGDTFTRGAVLRPVRWAALVYNASNSIRPNPVLDVLGRPLSSQEGVGEDFGVRFFLFENRVNLGITRYDTDNTSGTFDGIVTRTQGFLVLNGIYQAFTDAGIAAKYSAGSFFTGFRDKGDSDGSGWEVELTANPTNRWRISANYSKTDLKVANVQPILNGLLAAEKPFWQQNASVPYLTRDGNLESFVRARDGTPARDFALNPATVGDADQFITQVVDGVNLQEGQLPLQHQTHAFNFFNSYTFAKLPLLGSGFTAGFGASYRSAAVVGYANNQPIYGKSFAIWNGMLRKRFNLAAQRSIELQLNVNNLFREHDLLPYAATAAGVNRWFLQRQRQSWALQATLNF